MLCFHISPDFYPDLDLVTIPRRARSGTQMKNGNGKCNTFDDLPAISLSSLVTRGMTWYRDLSGFCLLSFNPVCILCMCLPLHMYTWADDFCVSYVAGNLCTVSVDMEY